MFLRKLHIHKDGKEHGCWSLVETVRTPDGSRQRTLCYLGELNGSAHGRWQKTVEVCNEHGETTQLKLFPSEAEVPDDPNVARVLVKKVRVERTRRFGDCYLGLALWKRLGLDEFFAQHLDGDGADVAWSRVAAVLNAPSTRYHLELREKSDQVILVGWRVSARLESGRNFPPLPLPVPPRSSSETSTL